MKKINGLIIVCFICIFLFMQLTPALTANSSNYSVNRFGTGMAIATASSDNYNSTILSESEGTTRNAKSETYTGNIGFFSDTVYYRTVSITSYSAYPRSTTTVSLIRLYISALNPQSTWAIITRPDGVTENVVLSNNNYVYYTAGIVGRYNIIFYANSSTGAIASAVDYFDLTEQATPSQAPSGGGGGSTTTIIEKCSYIWDCTPWSICSEGKQARECKNLGDCTGIESKPIETRECSDALFDVIMTFNEVKLTPEGILRFSVDLTETKNVEKIDVQIRYSIIDSNNDEIVSQTETRAIQGNLTYEKEINEAKLTNGEYILRVDILYGKLQKAYAEQRFKIKRGVIEIIEPTSNIQRAFIYALVIISILTPLIVSIPFIRRVLIKKKKKSKNKIVEYKRRIKKNLKRIISKILLIILFSSIVIRFLFTLRKNIIGLIIEDSIKRGNWNIFGFILIAGALGLLVFAYRKKITGKIESKRRDKYSKSSLKGLIKKEVYTEEGNYVGDVDEIILEKNKVHSLKINLNKKQKFKVKGIIVRYKHVQSVGHVVIVDNRALKGLEDIKNYKNRK